MTSSISVATLARADLNPEPLLPFGPSDPLLFDRTFGISSRQRTRRQYRKGSVNFGSLGPGLLGKEDFVLPELVDHDPETGDPRVAMSGSDHDEVALAQI